MEHSLCHSSKTFNGNNVGHDIELHLCGNYTTLRRIIITIIPQYNIIQCIFIDNNKVQYILLQNLAAFHIMFPHSLTVLANQIPYSHTEAANQHFILVEYLSYNV